MPPDPSTFAASVDSTDATTIGDGTAFLYAGPNPIQTGGAPNTITRRGAEREGFRQDQRTLDGHRARGPVRVCESRLTAPVEMGTLRLILLRKILYFAVRKRNL